MDEFWIIEKLKKAQKERRLAHTLGVAKVSVEIAPLLGADVKKAYLAALLHDCAKNFDTKEQYRLCGEYGIKLDDYAKREAALIHAFLGAEVARREYGIKDREILDAIYFHTIARVNMTPLEKTLYLADMTEPGREMPQAETLRQMIAKKDFDNALIYALDCSIKHVIRKGRLIHPNSIGARNYLVIERENRKKKEE